MNSVVNTLPKWQNVSEFFCSLLCVSSLLLTAMGISRLRVEYRGLYLGLNISADALLFHLRVPIHDFLLALFSRSFIYSVWNNLGNKPA